MPNKELVDYINSSLSAGESPEKIRINLVTSGWKEEEVDDVLDKLVSIFDVNNPIVDFEIKHEVSHEVDSQNDLEQTKTLSSHYYLLVALIFSLVGFGSAIFAACSGGFMTHRPPELLPSIIAVFINSIAAYFAFMGIKEINYLNPYTGKKRSYLKRVFLVGVSAVVGPLILYSCYLSIYSLFDSLGLEVFTKFLNTLIFW